MLHLKTNDLFWIYSCPPLIHHKCVKMICPLMFRKCVQVILSGREVVLSSQSVNASCPHCGGGRNWLWVQLQTTSMMI